MFKKSLNNCLILTYTFLLIGHVFADQGTGDSFGYMWTDSNDPPNIDFAWEDISNETNIFGDSINENLSGAIPLPFSFSFYGGTAKTEVYISANGWLSFTDPGGLAYPTNTSIPAGAGPDAMLAVYWDDLISSTGNGGGVYYKEEGTAPNRRFIVQWHMLNGTPDPDEIEFQVILYETSNLIKFQYNIVDTYFNGGDSATIGIKNNTFQGNQRSFDQSDIVSAGSAILFHNSSVSGISAGISPTSVQIGSYQSFTYTINNIVGPTGLGKLDRIAIGIPLSNIPAVTGVAINGNSVGIQNSSSKPTNPGIATWQYLNYTGVDSIIVQTSYFEIVNSITVTFLMGIPNTTIGSYQFGSSGDAELDADNPVIQTSPSVTLTSGPLNQISIRNGSGGSGTEVTDLSLTTDDTYIFYAAGYDAGGNFIGDQVTAEWTLAGTLDQPGNSGSSFTFNPLTAPTSGTISADVDGITGVTGNITVGVGILNQIRINSSAGPDGLELSSAALTAGQSLNLYASGYDADGNYRSAESVSWSSTGSLDPISASGTSYTFTPTTAPSSGTIIADNGTFTDATGAISVSAGVLSYIKIRSAAGGGGSEVGSITITTDDILMLYAAGYDVSDNFIGDQSTAEWTLAGTLDQPGGSGSSFTFNPHTAPTSGSISANVDGNDDATGNITVGVGILDHVRINSSAGSGGVEFGSTTLTSGQSLNLYASGYDADGNYRSAENVNWSSTGTLDPIATSGTSYTFTPTTAPSSGTIIADNGSFSDTTGTITVSEGTLSYIQIRSEAGGLGSQVGTVSMSADDILPLYAAGYDINNNYLGDVSATWVTTGSLDDISQTAASINFEPVFAPSSGTIIAQVGNGDISNATGTISVSLGALDHIQINDESGSGGVEIGNLSLSSGQLTDLYASGYDSDNNYISAITATWASTGTLDPVSALATSYEFTPVTAPTSGSITITDGVRTDTTGTITVSTGAFTKLIIRDQPGGLGAIVDTRSLTTDDSLVLYAASYDNSDNYLGDQSVSWLSTGNLDNVNATGSSYVFDPVTASTSGQIIAQSGTISDRPGSP
ncbi:MAG: hypothetical protein P8Y99_05060, partial [Calditrichaceae bacterium]